MPRCSCPRFCGLLFVVSFFAARPLACTAAAEPKHSATPKAERIAAIRAAAEGELRVRPTFTSAGFSFGRAAEDEVVFECRVVSANDQAWTPLSPKAVRFQETRDWRGSAMNLAEDTCYEMRAVDARGATLATAKFRTWRSDVPVARTVVLDPATLRTPYIISEKGSEDGWIRYTMKPGAPLGNPDKAISTIRVQNAAYVLLDDLVLRDGTGESRYAVDIATSRYVRVRNCEFSQWGRAIDHIDYARPEPEKGRKTGLGAPIDRQGKGIDYDGAVHIGKKNSGVVIERCWMHDPVGKSCAWHYSHPKGPEAVLADGPDHSTVLRWNDFTGSDEHRWNDAVEGPGNFVEWGGLNRDADVFGNFMIFANDDCIELDGGMQNVRCCSNRFEGAHTGVSIQGCMVSPVYVMDNLFSGLGDEYGVLGAGQTIKTGGGAHGEEATAFIRGNVLWGDGSGLTLMKLLRCHVWDNVFAGPTQKIRGTETIVAGHNEFSADPFPESGFDPALPHRPLPFTLDVVRFPLVSVKDGEPPTELHFTATAAAPVPFRIAKNDVFDWFEVEPSAGTLSVGRNAFTVRFRPERLKSRRDWRGCFLVRAENGLSRPVSLYVKTDYVQPIRCERPGEFALYAPDFQLKKGGRASWTFDLEKDGRYWFMIRGRITSDGETGRSRIGVLFDGEVPPDVYELSATQKRIHGTKGFEATPGLSVHPLHTYPTWTMVVPGSHQTRMVYHWDLKAGRHTIDLKGGKGAPAVFDALVLTDSPGSFEAH